MPADHPVSAKAGVCEGDARSHPAEGALSPGGLQQWGGWSYQYAGHHSENADFTSNRLEETYHLQTGLAILNTHLINFTLSGDVGFRQTMNSSDVSGTSTGNNTSYQYALDGSALDRSWHPVNIFSSRQIERVVAPFTPTFDSTSSRSGVDAFFVRGPFTAKFRYKTNTLEITGVGADSKTTSDAFQATGSHNYRDVNNLTVSASLSGSKSAGGGLVQKGYGNSVQLGDNLYFGAGSSTACSPSSRGRPR